MSSESEKEKESNSLIDQEEEAPTIGLNSTFIATGKSGLRFRLKLLMPRDQNEKEKVASDVNCCKKEEGHNEEVSTSAVVSAETNSGKDVKSPEEAQSVSGEGELKEKATADNEAPEEWGSSESKVSDNASQTPTCEECLKTFPSFKSLYGHLRCHPDRDYRGSNRPARGLKRPAISSSPPDRASPVSGWAVKRKRRQSIEEEEEEEEEEEAVATGAEILMSISKSKHWGSIKEEEIKEEEVVKTEEAALSESPEKIRKCSFPASTASKTYQCRTCNKSFSTHQALGGHRASHNKHTRNNNSEAEALEGAAENGAAHAREGANPNGAVARAAPAAEHRCKYCNEMFATGQALGGHMRRHWPGPPPSAVSSPESVKGESHAAQNVNENQNGLERARSENISPISFDLNEAPPQLEEEGELQYEEVTG